MAEPETGPKVGTDEWVARAGERTERRSGLAGRAQDLWERLPVGARAAPFVVLCLVFPLLPAVADSEYLLRVAINCLLLALLGLGLNVAVGWTGILDLGYVAFYGFGAYMYAFLASDHFGISLPTELAILFVVIGTTMLGFLLALPSRRLIGDYLAIVSLFFAQIFVVLTQNGNRITLPWNDGPSDITGGPNGIADLDQFDVFGFQLGSVKSYYWFSLAAFFAVVVLLWHVNNSRTGRAWRSLREDSLAAELMSVPVNRMKLFAIALGAAIAGLAGSIFAALQTGVFPQNFDIPLLITIYAVVVLGGAGSIPGVVLGAIVITTVFETLSTPDEARYAFYAAVVISLVGFVRPWWRMGFIAGGTVLVGVVAFRIADAVRPAWTSGTIEGGWLAELLDGWVIHPAFPEQLGKYAFVAAIAGAILLTQIKNPWARTIGAPFVIYLGAVAWEGILIENPSVTRLILLGIVLVVLMNRRPEGLLGQKRVEIV
jgi:branched-chain amino acid transport system permease protein